MKKLWMLVVLMMLVVGGSSFAHIEGPVEGENVFDHLHNGEKRAILMVHFGTTYADTREKTIDAVNEHVGEDFGKDFEIREAYSSRQVINVLKSRGIHKDNPIEALNKLKEDGYTHVLVQMTTVINGIESENLKKEVAMFEDKFKVIRTGTPLLSSLEDYKKVAKALVDEIHVDDDTAVVLVGHGTPHYSSASYAKMDHIFKTMGYANYFVGALQGYLTEDLVEEMVAKGGYKKVVLAPFMVVAGDHTINDIGEDWVDAFEKAGYETELLVKGLGESRKIQHIYIDSIARAMVLKEDDMAARKAALAKK